MGFYFKISVTLPWSEPVKISPWWLRWLHDSRKLQEVSLRLLTSPQNLHGCRPPGLLLMSEVRVNRSVYYNQIFLHHHHVGPKVCSNTQSKHLKYIYPSRGFLVSLSNKLALIVTSLGQHLNYCLFCCTYVGEDKTSLALTLHTFHLHSSGIWQMCALIMVIYHLTKALYGVP